MQTSHQCNRRCFSKKVLAFQFSIFILATCLHCCMLNYIRWALGSILKRQWIKRGLMIKNGQTILTLHFPSCQNFANSKWLSIKFSTLPVGCYGGTSRCYGNNDVIKPWQSNFSPFIPFVPRFQVSVRSHNSTSNSPQTQGVVTVAKPSHNGINGVKITWPWFYDVIVAITTTCATMTTYWVCKEFDVKSCGNVETVAQR